MAQDIPNNFVELDGNSVVDGTPCTAPDTPAGCKDDWNLLNAAGGPNPTGSAGGSQSGLATGLSLRRGQRQRRG
jgi:hypothetical protein